MQSQKKDVPQRLPDKEQGKTRAVVQLLQPAGTHQQLSFPYGVCYVDTIVTFVLYKRLKSACQRTYIEVFLDL